MPTLSDIPIEVLLDNVLPSVRTADVLALGSTSRFFTDITNDDTFWKRRIQSDFNFDVQNTARNSGWKFIYRGLRHPKTFVWGCVAHQSGRYERLSNLHDSERSWGRLGVDNIPREYLYAEGVPAPMEIKIPGKRIVSLVPGGT
jgi:SCF-associated factor 1